MRRMKNKKAITWAAIIAVFAVILFGVAISSKKKIEFDQKLFEEYKKNNTFNCVFCQYSAYCISVFYS